MNPDEECDTYINEMKNILKSFDLEEYLNLSTDEQAQNNTSEEEVSSNYQLPRLEYLYESANNISYFFENDVVDRANRKINMPLMEGLGKVGHGVHLKNDVFHKLVFSKKAKTVLDKLGFEDVAVPQGMYILKLARIGSPVAPHVDATYLFNRKNDPTGIEVDPTKTLIGFWLALEDATPENGCLCMAFALRERVKKQNVKKS